MTSDAFFRLDGRVALVTGGGRGIGEAICRRLASAGARVAVFDRDAASAAQIAGAVGGRAVAGDVTSEADISRALAESERTLGPIDILVNNAGITGRSAKTWELTRADLEQVLAVNLVAPFLWCRAVMPGMLRRPLRPHRHHRLHRRQGGEPGPGPVFRQQGGRHLPDQVAGQGGRGAGRHHGQRHFARGDRDAAAGGIAADHDRLHGVPHPDGSHRPAGGSGRPGTLPRQRRGQLHDGAVLRHQRRAGDLLRRRRRHAFCDKLSSTSIGRGIPQARPAGVRILRSGRGAVPAHHGGDCRRGLSTPHRPRTSFRFAPGRKPKPVVFPDPEAAQIEIDGIQFLLGVALVGMATDVCRCFSTPAKVIGERPRARWAERHPMPSRSQDSLRATRCVSHLSGLADRALGFCV